jgi:hypothetical protein
MVRLRSGKSKARSGQIPNYLLNICIELKKFQRLKEVNLWRIYQRK